nr:EAL domain-containing protein [Vibrio cincinnatiensis]
MAQIIRLIEPVSQYMDFEVTESSLLQDKTKLAGVFERLHQLGCHIHIDDFGTGYSSMSYLNLFDIDTIKIDRSFVQALDTEKGRKVFSGIYAVANELAMDVIVEGVETQEQLNFVSQYKQVAVQGWYYSKPLIEQDFIDYVMLRQGIFSLAG